MTTIARDVEAVQRHTIRVLVVAQVFGALGMTIGFATAALLARDISGSDTQSGLVQTCQVLGAAVASYLLARMMSRRGRRAGLVTGLLPERPGLLHVRGTGAKIPLVADQVGSPEVGLSTGGEPGRSTVGRRPRQHLGEPALAFDEVTAPPPGAPERARDPQAGVGGGSGSVCAA